MILSWFDGFEFNICIVLSRGRCIKVFILFWKGVLIILNFIWFLLFNLLKLNMVEIVELNVIILIFMLLGLIVR